MKQLELFDNIEKSQGGKSFKTEEQNIHQIRRFKHWLFLTIYTIIVLVVGFILGIEQEKRKIKLIPLEEKSEEKTRSSPTLKKPISVVKPDFKKTKFRYEIQVASFKKSSVAKSLNEALKKAGFKAYVATTGQYMKVCIGPFKTKKEAQEQIVALRKKYPTRYKDCFIRKITEGG